MAARAQAAVSPSLFGLELSTMILISFLLSQDRWKYGMRARNHCFFFAPVRLIRREGFAQVGH
jgi:hypothetical protein